MNIETQIKWKQALAKNEHGGMIDVVQNSCECAIQLIKASVNNNNFNEHFKQFSDDVVHNSQVVLSLLHSDRYNDTYRYLIEPLLNSEYAVNVIAILPEEFKNVKNQDNLEMLELALKDGDNYQYLREDLKQNNYLKKLAVAGKPSAFRFLSEEERFNENIINLIPNKFECYQYFNDKLKLNIKN